MSGFAPPAGYRLGDGWEILQRKSGDWGCSAVRGGRADGHACNALARYRHKTKSKRHPMWFAGCCETVSHAVQLGALVPVGALSAAELNIHEVTGVIDGVVVYEVTTGMLLGQGDTLEDALEDARRRAGAKVGE